MSYDYDEVLSMLDTGFFILIRYVTGEMQVSLRIMVEETTNWFSKVKKLLKLSEASDANFGTKNYQVWKCFFQYYCSGYLFSATNKRNIQHLYTIYRKQKGQTRVLF